MELTKEDAVRLHRELWGWLAEHPEEEKGDWPGWQLNEGPYEDTSDNKCFACDYCSMRCGECLFIWPDAEGCSYRNDMGSLGGLFSAWVEAIWDNDSRAKLAAQIRDLPIREEAPNEPST